MTSLKIDGSTSNLSLKTVLDQQLQAAHDLARILDREATAIKDRDAQALNNIAPEKLAGLNNLELLEKTRLHLDTSDTSVDSNLTDKLWGQVIDVIRVCDKKNQLNGAMLSLRQEHIQRAMDLIADRDAAAITYAPDGSTHSGAGNFSTSVSA